MSGLPANVASFLGKLEQAYPELRIAGPLLRRQAPAALAFEGVAHELLQATFHLPDAVAATGKLQWWNEELQRCVAGEARHPLTREIRAASPLLADALAPLLAMAVRRHDLPPAADFGAQQAGLEPAFIAVEHVRASLLGTSGTAVAAQARLGLLSHLLRELARLPLLDDENRGSAIPMQLLARHQLDRAALVQAGAARDALVREQLAAISVALDELAPRLRATAGWLARVRGHCERWRARALPAGDPFPPLWSRLDRAPWNTAWIAWREARRGG